MTTVKRLEIIVESVLEKRVARAIEEAGVGGWTLHRNAAGLGSHGLRDAEGLTAEGRNSVFIVAAPPEAAERLLALLRPLLARHGGACLVSDAAWLDR